MKQHSIGRKAAIALAHTKWWVGQSARNIAKRQLLTAEMIMPFDLFHAALEEALGRPVWTHELGLNLDGLIQELFHERDAPSLTEIVDLIPENKRVIVQTENEEGEEWKQGGK